MRSPPFRTPRRIPATPYPEATVDDVPLTDDADGTVEPGWGVEIDTDTDMVGVRWDGDAEATFTVEARDDDGNWTPAVEAPPVDGGPDAGSPDAIHAESVLGDSRTTDPVWVGDATAVRVRLADGEASDVELIDVDSPEATYPEGSAGAIPPQPTIRSRASWGADGPDLFDVQGAVGGFRRRSPHRQHQHLQRRRCGGPRDSGLPPRR